MALLFLRERDFRTERVEWIRERGELLSRIQAPEAAPFLFEADEKDAENDLPLPPTSEFDPHEVEKAREHLVEVGYEESGTGL